MLTAGRRQPTVRTRVRRRWLGWPASGRACLLALAVGAVAAGLFAGFVAPGAAADASGGGTATNTTATGTGTGTITNLFPTIVATPRLQLVSVRVTRHSVEFKLACAFSACEVAASLTTVEHLRAGRATLLSASGAGRETRAVSVGSLKPWRILPGKTQTVTLTLNGTGLRLLGRFRSLPTRAAIVLTDGSPVATVHRTLTVS